MFDNSEIKCPHCNSKDYECIDTLIDDTTTNDQVTLSRLCWCEKCNTNFEIFSTYTLKSTHIEEVSAS